MVETASQTPDPEVEDELEGTPAGEPADDSTETTAADQSAAAAQPPPSQAEFTRAQQAFAALKTELGLPRTASREQVLEAVRASKTAAPAGTTDEPADEDEDPRMAELRRERDQYREQAISVQMDTERKLSGDLADDAFRFVNLARDPQATVADYVQAARELVLKHRDAFAEELEAGDEDAGEEAGTPEADIDLSEGDSPTARPDSAGRRNRETALTGAVRGLFKQAAEATRR